MGSNVSTILKEKRKGLGLSVKTVLDELRSYDIEISDKTLYGWESGHRQPDADTFLALCQIYGIDTLKGTAKAPSTSDETDSQADSLRSTLLHNFDQLNHEGQERLAETSDDMVSSGKYIKSDTAELGKEA